MTFLASPWLLKSSVIMQFGSRESCWSEEGWCRCQMSINLQSIIVTAWCWSRPGNDLVTRPWMVEPIQAEKYLKHYTCKNITWFFLLAPAYCLLLCLFFCFFNLCHHHCPLPRRWACYILSCAKSSSSISTKSQWCCKGSHGVSPENPQKLFPFLLLRSGWPLLEIKHWFFSALLAFRQHILYQKGLCQELENVPNNGEKYPNINIHLWACTLTSASELEDARKALKSWEHVAEAFA